MKKTLLILFLSNLSCVFNHAEAITGLTGSYKIGQVFLTWNKASDPSAFYKIYRSPNPITNGGQLPACEYLGKTDSKSAKDFNLSDHDGTDRYLHIDSGAAPLSSSIGLFVATTLENGNYYYAVTVISGSAEDINISPGNNSLVNPLVEIVMMPAPVFQERRTQDNKSYDIYTTFYSSRFALNQPLSNASGFMAFDFALLVNTTPGLHPLRIIFHPGGVDFINNITNTQEDEIVLSCEDRFPGDETSAWWGANENFDIYNPTNNLTPPATGINYTYTLQRITNIINWVIAHSPVDSNRIYMEGISFGAPGAYFYSITYPERIAASRISTGLFNFSFLNDYQPNCKMNPGKKNRKSGDNRLGMVSTNLMSNMGYPTYDLLNGGWMVNHFSNKSYPVIYAVCGKRDEMMGWTEKPIYYDSINANHTGGYYFWDNRDHAGNGKTWSPDNFNLFRYRKNLSFPAFSNCSLNEDYGTGDGSIGLEYGTVNGALDWKNEIQENETSWEVKIFIRNLLKFDGNYVVYPDSCTADVTPRRIQHFQVPAGGEINWEVTHNNEVIQSGSVIYNGNYIVIPDVKIFRDTSTLHLNFEQLLNTFYYDADGDGYGDAEIPVQAVTAPEGYVSDQTDCNDGNATVHLSPDALISPSGIIYVCSGKTVVLNANTSTGFLYQWFKNDVAITGAINDSYVVSKNQEGNFKVAVTNSGGCSTISSSTVLNKISNPLASITALGNLDICTALTVTLKASGDSSYSYKWFKNTVKIAGEFNSAYVAASAGSYTVKVIENIAGCNKTSSPVIVYSSCKQSTESGDAAILEVSFYPNPGKGYFFITIISGPYESQGTLEVLNILGEIIFTEEVIVSGNTFNKEFHLPAACDNGIYLVSLKVNSKKFNTLLSVIK